MGNLVLRKEGEYSWINFVKGRVSSRKNNHFTGFFEGQTGSGKSWAALSFCSMVDPNFTIDQVVFDPEEFLELIDSDKVKRGSAILFEEVGIAMDSQRWQTLMSRILKYTFETIRHRNFIIILTAPYIDYLNSSIRKLISAIFEMRGIDYSNRTSKVKPLLLQYNSKRSKMYYKHLRIITKKGVVPLKSWDIPAPSKELIDVYEKRKRQFTDQLKADLKEEIRASKEKKEKKKYGSYWKCTNCSYIFSRSLEDRKPSRCPTCNKSKFIIENE